MKKNIGSADQLVRFLLAFITVMLFLGDSISGTLLVILFILLAVTSLSGFCPLYHLFKWNTNKKQREEE